MGKKKGHSEKKTDWFGRPYIQHYNADGKKSGRSERKQTLFGTKYTQHYDGEGHKIGRSERKQTLFGRKYTQKYDSGGEKSGTSENKRTLFGTPYRQHYDTDGNKTDRSEYKQTLFGRRYVERIGEDTSVGSETRTLGTSSPSSSYTSSGSYYGSASGYSSNKTGVGRFWSAAFGCIAGFAFIEIAGPTAASIGRSNHLSTGGGRGLLVLMWLYITGILVGVAVAGVLGGKKSRAGKASASAFILTLVVWFLMFFGNVPVSPSAELAGIQNTHWRGHVGRAPAALDIRQEESGGSLSGRISYEGIIEDLAVTRRTDGTLVLQGTGSRRESGNGRFALDTFYGTVSSDGQTIGGSLVDGGRRQGQWSVSRIVAGADLANVTVRSLFPGQTSITRWKGNVGKWPARLEIVGSSMTGEWKGHLIYRNVREELAISVKQDGSVLLVGTSYQHLAGEGAFFLDTFYGQLSADGQRLYGLRIDDAQSRGQWSVTRENSSEPATERQSPLPGQASIGPSFDCGKAQTNTEIEICTDGNLAALEADMASAYHRILDQLVESERADFRRWHLDWFTRYQNSCNLEALGSQKLKDCIAATMIEHTSELKSRMNVIP